MIASKACQNATIWQYSSWSRAANVLPEWNTSQKHATTSIETTWARMELHEIMQDRSQSHDTCTFLRINVLAVTGTVPPPEIEINRCAPSSIAIVVGFLQVGARQTYIRIALWSKYTVSRCVWQCGVREKPSQLRSIATAAIPHRQKCMNTVSAHAFPATELGPVCNEHCTFLYNL